MNAQEFRRIRFLLWPNNRFNHVSRLFALFIVFVVISHMSINQDNSISSSESGAANCLCHGENFCYKGFDRDGPKFGRPFDCSLYNGLKSRKLLDSDAQKTPTYDHQMDKNWTPVFATSVSANHIGECRVFVKQIRSLFPDSKIVVFDLGLKEEQAKEVDSWCGVERRIFDFSKFPEHVRNLKTYAFKSVVIEMLQIHPAFFLYDVSVRVQSTNLTQVVEMVQNGTLMPISTHTFASHNVVSSTHPEMYTYLPIDKRTALMRELQSGLMFVVDSPFTRKAMKWWYLCAMTQNCVAPPETTNKCNFTNYSQNPGAHIPNCHRFDQAFWNLFHLTELFGENQMAVKMGYAEDLKDLNEGKIAVIDVKQRYRMNKAFDTLVTVDRGDNLREKLRLPCT